MRKAALPAPGASTRLTSNTPAGTQGDIELPALHFLELFNAKEGTSKVFSRHALGVVQSYAWPDNMRELRNVVQRVPALYLQLLVIDESTANCSSRKPHCRPGQRSVHIGIPLADT